MLFLILLLLSPVSSSSSSSSSEGSDPRTPVSVSSDAASLLTLKSQNDPTNSLHFTLTEHLDYCHWPGIKCESSQVIRLFLPNSSLRNPIHPDSIPRLSQLRVLVLRNNSLSGTLPDLSPLHNLRSLILSFNSFSGPFPPSILSLYKLRVLDLSFNSFSGTLPYNLCLLDRLVSLKLQFNKFNAALPNINQTNLQVFNVSANNFSGEIVSTTVLSRFPQSSFSLNPFLCGALLHKPCANRSTFLDSSSASDATNHPSLVTPPSSTQPPQHQNQNQKKKLIILVFTFAGMLLFSSLICLFLTTKSKMRHNTTTTTTTASSSAGDSRDAVEKTYFTTASTAEAIIETQDTNNNNNNIKINQYKEKSGNLVFCVGEAKQYTLEQLFRASAEMLGRGTVGTTYKAKLDNQLIVTVKRLDAMKMSGVNGEVFEHHMGVVGGLRHPNLVPVRAFFQARQERLIIFDYQPNGSVFSLIHGSRSTRAKPLHWTSCLKIAEDVAQGLAYIHQASKLIHGNLKASNVLLGVDFEACITDYCLATLAESSEHEDPDSARYRGPEARQSGRRATHKSDVYAFGVLLLELLSGKRPSQHPFLASPDMPDWVKAVRGVDDGSEENQLGMLVEVASICSLTSPEQRPTMWQVLKMIQRIKDSVGPDDGIDTSTG